MITRSDKWENSVDFEKSEITRTVHISQGRDILIFTTVDKKDELTFVHTVHVSEVSKTVACSCTYL